MNYYQHHIGDFIRDTARLNDSQCMAYLRLLWMYYETEEPLSGDVDAIAFRIGANASDVHQILKHFFFEHEGMWHQSRCDKEILAFREKSDKAKRSADARWSNANAMRTHNERNANEHVSDANQQPVTNNQVKTLKTAPDKPAFDPVEIPLPDCIPRPAWAEWIAYRRERKLSVKERTMIAQVSNLCDWSSKGHSVVEILKASISNGWQGLFEPKNKGPTNYQDDRNETLRALTGGRHGTPTTNERDITGEAQRLT